MHHVAIAAALPASEAIRLGLAPSCLTFQLSLLLQNGNFEAALDPTGKKKVHAA
jgi:hypothetical protein